MDEIRPQTMQKREQQRRDMRECAARLLERSVRGAGASEELTVTGVVMAVVGTTTRSIASMWKIAVLTHSAKKALTIWKILVHVQITMASSTAEAFEVHIDPWTDNV